ncbi:MAG TPA: hypothetical protein VGH80_00575 [Xanthomonadaceae bacterium]|jgi:ABC-type transport system involved in multi-copper enzyme maturation permease subunit
MSALRRFGAILVADLRERTRATRFWVVLALIGVVSWWCLPPASASYLTVSFGDNVRGAYSSAWVGMVLGLMNSTMLSLIGFYLVRGTLVRDFETRVWQLLVATPMTRAGYLLAKWASHMAVFALIMLVGLAVGAVAQFVRAEDRAFDLVELVKPVVVLALPAMALTAFFAVLFDLVPWLRRTAGNVLYLFVWMGVTISENAPGIGLAQHDVYTQLAGSVAGITGTNISIGVGDKTGKLVLFAWTHWHVAVVDLVGRAGWIALAMVAVAALAPLLDRAAARAGSAGAGRGASAGRRLRWLDRLLRPLEFSTTGMLLAAELKLVLRQRRVWWWLAWIVSAIVQLVGARDAVGIAVICAWVMNADVFARAILRESDTGTGALLFSAAQAPRRLLLARIGAAVLLASATILPAIVHLAFVAPAAATALIVTATTVAVGGLALGVLCRNPRPFELVLVALAYVGVQNGGPLAAVVNPQWTLGVQAFLLPTLIVVLLALWPRFARWR